MATELVYTVRMMQVRGLDGIKDVQVPRGFLWVVRCMDFYANVTFASREVHVIGAGGQTFFWKDWNTEDQFAIQWTGRQVLHAGERLRVQTSDLIDVTISGYQLSLP